jgi:Big-like domain-containing protein/alpha/beta hydrolase family protein
MKRIYFATSLFSFVLTLLFCLGTASAVTVYFGQDTTITEMNYHADSAQYPGGIVSSEGNTAVSHSHCEFDSTCLQDSSAYIGANIDFEYDHGCWDWLSIRYQPVRVTIDYSYTFQITAFNCSGEDCIPTIPINQGTTADFTLVTSWIYGGLLRLSDLDGVVCEPYSSWHYNCVGSTTQQIETTVYNMLTSYTDQQIMVLFNVRSHSSSDPYTIGTGHSEVTINSITFEFGPIVTFLDGEEPSRTVTGASADGASEVLIQIKNVTEGDNIEVSIPEGDGSLIGEGTISNGVFTQVYRAPYNFVRSDFLQEDLAMWQRPLNIHVSVNNQELTVPEFNLVKPPVVLLHGLWSNPSVWDALSSKLINENGYQFTFSMPLNPASHFDQNKSLISTAIDNALIYYNKNLNLVAKKADIVGHSMGGLLVKLHGQASKIRSITTVGTPHCGSGLADRLWDLLGNDQNVFGNYVAALLKKSGHPVRDGAIEDLRVNGGIHCYAGNINVPNYVISGISSILQEDDPLIIGLLYLFKLHKDLNIAAGLADLNEFLFPERNDWIVSESSQEGGLQGDDDDVLWHVSEPHDVEVMEKIINFIHGQTPPSIPSQTSCLSQSDNKLELANEIQTYEMPNSSGWVQINSPNNGQEFQPGDRVSVTVEASDTNAMVLITTSTGESKLIERSPYRLNFRIPEDVVGQVSILVGATDDIGFIGSDEVIINVASTSDLTNIKVYPDNNQLFLKEGTSFPLTVYGSYDDGVDRNITSLSTTQYTSSDPSIVTVSETGIVNVVSAGEVIITVSNNQISKQLNVIATSLEDFDYDGDIDGSDLSIFLNAYATGDLTVDLDNNGIVDANDVGTFSGEFGKN